MYVAKLWVKVKFSVCTSCGTKLTEARVTVPVDDGRTAATTRMMSIITAAKC